MADGMIHLGKTYPTKDATLAKTDDTKKESFPSFHAHDIKGMDNLPSGHFHFHGVGKVVHSSKNHKTGTSSHEIEIHSIKPLKKGDKAGGGLSDKLDEIAKKKSKTADDAEDKADNGVDEDNEST